MTNAVDFCDSGNLKYLVPICEVMWIKSHNLLLNMAENLFSASTWNLLDVYMKIQKKKKSKKSNNNLNYFLLRTIDAFSFMWIWIKLVLICAWRKKGQVLKCFWPVMAFSGKEVLIAAQFDYLGASLAYRLL